MYFLKENYRLFGGKRARLSGELFWRSEGAIQVGWNFPYKLFIPKPGWFSDFLMILQSITYNQAENQAFAIKTQNENQPSETGQPDLPANSPHKRHHSNLISTE